MVSTPPAGGVAAHACLADERTIAVCPVQTSDRRSERSCRRNDYRRSVLEKGTTNGTITDFDGNFSLNVSSDKAVLVISYVATRPKK